MISRLCVLLLVTALWAAPLLAHDFWIEPASFHPAPGERVAVRLRVGEGFQGEPVPRMSGRIERFVTVGAPGETPLQGVEGMDPAGWATFQSPGLYQVIYDSHHARVELDGPAFEKYLAEEGLESVIAQRAAKGQSAARAREVYSRSAKSLLAVGDGAAGSGWDRAAGLELELVPEANPYKLTPLAPDTELPVRLLFRGQPLSGALIVAFPKSDPTARVSARSDAQGRVRLRLGQPGVWLVKAVHMIPAAAGADADWESQWASLTFHLPTK
ncbi:MAG TPA: DUF4198 domain-containing protein [Thermoanaerobaculia bacterium]|nr:DUF4198 domain-containing protein [Thermoanaerobaculia bacterium]